jgi:hypothetical protein
MSEVPAGVVPFALIDTRAAAVVRVSALAFGYRTFGRVSVPSNAVRENGAVRMLAFGVAGEHRRALASQRNRMPTTVPTVADLLAIVECLRSGECTYDDLDPAQLKAARDRALAITCALGMIDAHKPARQTSDGGAL